MWNDLENLRAVEVPDRMKLMSVESAFALNRRMGAYLARRAAGEPGQQRLRESVVIQRPLTDEERAARAERLRKRTPEKGPRAYKLWRSEADAYRVDQAPKPNAIAPADPTPPATPPPTPAPERKPKPERRRIQRRTHQVRPRNRRPVDLNRDLNGMIATYLGIR